MQFLTPVLYLAVAQLVVASPVELETRQKSSNCFSSLHLIVGGGDDRSPGMANVNGLLQSLVTSIEKTFPATTEYLPAYDGTAHPGPAADVTYKNAIEQYAASCPFVPIVLLGYSFGGIIMMNQLCGGISDQYKRNIIAAVAYGEETRVKGQSYDKGSCMTSSPGTYAQPRANPATCDAYASRIQSYCLASDPACCKTGTDYSNHFDYPQNYDSDALAFVKQQYYRRGLRFVGGL